MVTFCYVLFRTMLATNYSSGSISEMILVNTQDLFALISPYVL